MTAQIPDHFRYTNQDFSIAGISEGELFNPQSLNLKPVGVCTACWRGFQAIYTIAESRLVLQELNINLADDSGFHVDELGPPINGVMPVEPPQKHKLFRNAYKDLLYEIPYTGGVLIADGFIQNLYVHMGFHPGWKYETVIELLFRDGILQNAVDRSAKMAEIRQTFLDQARENDSSSRMSDSEIHNFVEQAFDLRYEM